MNVQGLYLDDSLWEWKWRKLGEHLHPSLRSEEYFDLSSNNFSKGQIWSGIMVGSLLIKLVVPKASFQNIRGYNAWERRVKALYRQCVCFHSFKPFCWDAYGNVRWISMPWWDRKGVRALNSLPTSICIHKMRVPYKVLAWILNFRIVEKASDLDWKKSMCDDFKHLWN